MAGFSTTLAGQTSPQDYPQWRGQHRDGAASAFSEPDTWPDALTHHWTVEVGDGYATPIIVGSTVYTFTRQDDDEVVTAIDAATGETAWDSRYRAPHGVHQAAAAHTTGPKATPLFHNGMVFTLGISGVVSAFETASGALVWQTDAPDSLPIYGNPVSPLGAGELVIVHPGDYGSLTAFEAATGETAWTATGTGVFASPILAELGGMRQVVTVTQTHVVGLALTDGAILWAYPWESQATPSAITPILYGDTVIVGSTQMGVRALRPTRLGTGVWRSDVAWETQDVSLFLSNPVVIDGTLFGLSERASGQYFALDAGTGEVLWLGPPRQAKNTAIVKAGDLLFLLNDSGELVVARGSQAGLEPFRRYTVAHTPTWAQPAISGDRIFVKDVSSLTLWTLDP